MTVASVDIKTSSVSLGSGLTRMHESDGRRTRGRRDAFWDDDVDVAPAPVFRTVGEREPWKTLFDSA